MVKVSEGKYKVGDSKTLIFMRVSDSVGVTTANSVGCVGIFYQNKQTTMDNSQGNHAMRGIQL